jgi:hypothetical protein
MGEDDSSFSNKQRALVSTTEQTVPAQTAADLALEGKPVAASTQQQVVNRN